MLITCYQSVSFPLYSVSQLTWILGLLALKFLCQWILVGRTKYITLVRCEWYHVPKIESAPNIDYKQKALGVLLNAMY